MQLYLRRLNIPQIDSTEVHMAELMFAQIYMSYHITPFLRFCITICYNIYFFELHRCTRAVQ